MPKVKYLFVPDLHLPYADWTKVREVARWAADRKPERVIFLGDILDCYLVSRFSKTQLSELSVRTVRREREGVARLRELFKPAVRGKAQPIWLQGNHEARIASRLGESAFLGHYTGDPMASWAEGFDYRATGDMVLPGLYVCHGFKAQRLAGSAAASLTNGRSVVQGHSHKLALIWCTGNKFAIESGYLASPTGPCFEYATGLRHGLRDWKHGFSWIDTEGGPHIEGV